MKYAFFILLLPILLSAQQPPDSIPIGRVIYLHQISLASDNENNGMASLLFNSEKSLYVHHGTPKETFQTLTDEGMPKVVVGDPEGYPVYKLHTSRKLHSKVPCHLVKGGCIVTDTLGAIEWAIHPERKMFGEYECRRATVYISDQTLPPISVETLPPISVETLPPVSVETLPPVSVETLPLLSKHVKVKKPALLCRKNDKATWQTQPRTCNRYGTFCNCGPKGSAYGRFGMRRA